MNQNKNRFDKFIAAIRELLTVLSVAIAVIGVLILIRSIVNAVFVYNYDHGSYLMIPERTMDYIGVGENYVVPYNLGNADYQRRNYEKAAAYYTQALSRKLPENEKECMIRVNLALSICHTIDFDNLDLEDTEAVMEAISILYEARYVLTEKGCASEPVGSSDGHYDNADKLRKDIDDMLKYLSQYTPNEKGQGDGGGGGGQDEDQDKNQDQDQDRSNSRSDSSKSQEEKEKQERERQEELREDLKQQKKDLKEKSESTRHNDYEYLDGGDAQGYGDGTLW